MLTEYLEKAMRHAVYEDMKDGEFFGRIRELKDPWAGCWWITRGDYCWEDKMISWAKAELQKASGNTS